MYKTLTQFRWLTSRVPFYISNTYWHVFFLISDAAFEGA